ncbi:hypothetical protein GCM10011317_29200 [Niveispirillum cyanobacteriorum]|nr:hypothetical protein GCM10011317_29200 [Niveispirillum cyanobacteriorum]
MNYKIESLSGGSKLYEFKVDENIGNISSSDLMGCAFVQAIFETFWTSTRSNLDEETHTASFMGHLSTSLFSWVFAASYSQSEVIAPEIGWGHSGSHESRLGTDFALTLPFCNRCKSDLKKCSCGEKREGGYRLIVFQAKSAHKTAAFSVNHLVKGRVKDKEKASDKVEKGEIEEQNRERIDLLKKEAVDRAKCMSTYIENIKNKYNQNSWENFRRLLHKTELQETHTQYESLARLFSYSIDFGQKWIYYVIWNHSENTKYGDGFPVTKPFQDIIFKNSNRVNDGDATLVDIIDEFLSFKSGIFIPDEKIKNFIGEAVKLIPDFLIIKTDEGGSGLKLNNAIKFSPRAPGDWSLLTIQAPATGYKK